MPVIQNANSQRAGIINFLMETWRQKFPTFEEQFKLLVMNLPYTTIRNAEYGWKESVPFPSKWKYGTPRTYKTFKDRRIRVSLMPFTLNIPYNKYDEMDDQLGDMKTHVNQSIDRYGMLPDQLVAEYFNNTLTGDLNDAFASVWDGASLFSATDGNGDPRGKVSGGNIVTGSGNSVAAIMHDMAVVQRRFMAFRDTANQPIFTEAQAAYTRMHAIIPTSLNEKFQKITKQDIIRSDAGSVTAESNYLKGEFFYHVNPYLTDAEDYFVALEHPYWKPFVYRNPGQKGLRQIFADYSNSDHARNTNEEALLTDIRVGLGLWFVLVLIKVTQG